MPIPGDTLIKRFSLIDGAGAPISGASFTMIGRFPSGATYTPLQPTSRGNGVYEVRWPTSSMSSTGHYYIRATSNTTPRQLFEFEWVVSPPGTAERWKQGDTLVERITVIDHLGTPITGVAFETFGIGPDGREIPAPPLVERGNGAYEAMVRTSPLDRPGSTYVQARAIGLDPAQVFEIEWITGASVPVSGGHTLRQVRRMVMARFGDIVTMEATATGTTSTLIDHDNLYGEPGRFAGREVMFTSGLNAGQMRYVTGSSRTDSAISFNRPLPYSTRIGDEADMTNAFGIGVTFRAVKDAINHAIAVARQYHLVPVTYETPEPYERDDDAVMLPLDMVGVERVAGVDDQGQERSIGRASSRGANGWSLDHAAHSVILRGNESRQADGWRLRVAGYTLPHDLVHEDDVTTVDIEWLVDMATSHLCLDTLLSRQATGDWGSKGMLYKQNAERLLSRLTPVLRSSFVRFM